MSDIELPEDHFDDWEAEEDAWEAQWADLQKNRAKLPEVQREAVLRWDNLTALRKHYVHFSDFLYDAMTELMGFDCTAIQLDIGDFLEHGPQYSMVQAQRSQAKSTIVAIYAVWCLIHNPKYRVLIVSAGSDVALEIANWIIQIIMSWDILTCMRPDRQHGDRSSSKAFDVHWQLKGTEKSPSVACIGITANMQGRRADLLVPDDIESSKNGLTEIQRQNLIHLSKDFTSICQRGRIMYMGTPQSVDSIYNTLPGRGYTIRIWPGRYPTEDQEAYYGEHLAPLIRKAVQNDPSLRQGGGFAGEQGQPTDPELLPEETLTSKELDQGIAYFQLQHMLNTSLTDEGRFPLKAKNLIVSGMNMESGPGSITWMSDPARRITDTKLPEGLQLFTPWKMSLESFPWEGKAIYVDPAGGGANGDETVAWVTYFLHGYIWAAEMLAIPGGYDDEFFQQMSSLAYRHQVNYIWVEDNFGKGAFAQMWRPVLQEYYESKTGTLGCPTIEDDTSMGQKELRIIDRLEPVMARHRLIINSDVIEYNHQACQRYSREMRSTYCLWHQLSKITRDRGALIHDDRIETLAGAVHIWSEKMAIREEKRIESKAENTNVLFLKEWYEKSGNNGAFSGQGKFQRAGNKLGSKSRRKR